MVITLPKTNSSPLKIGLPKRKLIFQPRFREGRTGGLKHVFVDMFALGWVPTPSHTSPMDDLGMFVINVHNYLWDMIIQSDAYFCRLKPHHVSNEKKSVV